MRTGKVRQEGKYETFEPQGFEVLSARSGARALRMLPGIRSAPGFSQRIVEDATTPVKDSDFVHWNGLLLVKPYWFDFICGVKGRHAGHNIIDLFCQEFPALTREYYEAAFANGRLRVEGGGRAARVQATTPLLAGDRIRHFLHRHEPPVLDITVTVLSETPDIVAVNKPPCMPVHVAGQHRKNTVAGVLQALRPDLGPLLPVHRLDKPVSGVLLFARSPQAATRICKLIQSHQVEKIYIALVSGVFPEQPVTVDVALSFDSAAGTAHAHPLLPHDSEGNAAIKCASTSFKRLWVANDGATSLVQCRPKTGRSHQIRKHLAHVGHPIANDWLYGGRLGGKASTLGTGRAHDSTSSYPLTDTCGHSGEHGGGSSDVVSAVPSYRSAGDMHPMCRGMGHESSSGGATRDLSCPADSTVDPAVNASLVSCGMAALPTRIHPLRDHSGRDIDGVAAVQVDDSHFDDLCRHCPSMIPIGWPTDLNALWLHAQSYTGPGFAFSCPLPDWATIGTACEH